MNAVFANGSYITKQYTILNATGGDQRHIRRDGRNTNLPANFSRPLSYDANACLSQSGAELHAAARPDRFRGGADSSGAQRQPATSPTR